MVDTDEASVRSRVSYTAKGGGAVYMYEVVRVHVGMCAVGARARAFDCHEQAEQGREKVSALGRMGRTYADDTDVVHLGPLRARRRRRGRLIVERVSGQTSRSSSEAELSL